MKPKGKGEGFQGSQSEKEKLSKEKNLTCVIFTCKLIRISTGEIPTSLSFPPNLKNVMLKGGRFCFETALFITSNGVINRKRGGFKKDRYGVENDKIQKEKGRSENYGEKEGFF